MATVAERLITADEFEQMPESAERYELIRGEIVPLMSPGFKHGKVAVKLITILDTWANQTGGHVVVEVGYRLRHDPLTVRIPDVSYIRAERIPPAGIPDRFWTQAPDLAIEVVSPTETAEMVHGKVSDLLDAGTPMVWVVYPSTRKVVAHTPDGIARTYSPEATLEFPDLLPGFSCPVAAIFEQLPVA